MQPHKSIVLIHTVALNAGLLQVKMFTSAKQFTTARQRHVKEQGLGQMTLRIPSVGNCVGTCGLLQ